MFKKIGRLLGAMMGLLPTFAFAQTTGPFTVKDTDISVKILSQIFGSLTPVGGVDAFGGAISTFNGAILIVGGILATYTLLAGTLGTAHDGEMLGKKFSSVWIPIRYSLGTALVLPVLSGGYCIMQQLVMWCILQGVGLANAVWTSYLTSPNLTAPVYMTTDSKRAVLNFANNIALAQICTQANASILNAGGTGGGLIDKISQSVMNFNYDVSYSPDGTTAYFGDQAGKLTLLTRANCGSANLTVKPDSSQVIMPNTDSSGGKLGDISKAFRLGDISPVYEAHFKQAQDLITKMGVLAKTAVNSDSVLSESDVQTAADAYISGVQAAATSYSNGDNSPFAGIIAASKDQGWILAGAWFTKLAMMNQTLNDAVNSIPTANATFQLGSGFKFLDAVQPKISTARTAILESMNVPLPDSASDEKDDSKGKATQTSGIWSRIVQSVVQVFTGLDLENLQNTTKNPVLVLQDAGNRMITAWSTSITTLMLVVAPLGIRVLGNGFDAAPLVFTFIGFAMLPIAGLVTLGFTLAYLLPNLPFLMWIGIVLGWLIMCVEAILAAPLWAVMHLHPNGDDLTGRGGNGYMLLLGLLLRPALTIFGLIAALVLTELMGEFVNKIFFTVFFSGHGAGLTTILTVIFSMTVYTSAMVQLFRKTFALMHVIPDQLMRWIGGGQEQMGQYAGGLAEAGQKGVQAAGQTGSFLGERTAQSAGQMIGQAKNLIDKNNSDKARKEAAMNEQISQNQSFESAGVTSEEISSMNERTAGAASRLASSNPQSQEGIVLSNSQNKMIKARTEGERQVASIAGETGRKNFATAVAAGTYKGRDIGSFNGSNEFEREANFASFVANDIVTNTSTAQREFSADQQSQQTQALQGVSNKLDNLGKPNDPSITPPVGGSTSSVGGVTQNVNTGSGQNLPVQGELFGNPQDNIVNNALQTNLNGELLNPGLAQTIASSGAVNPVSSGLTGNAATVIRSGGSMPTQTPISSPEPMTPNISTGSQVTDFTPQSNTNIGLKTPEQIISTSDLDPSGQFSSSNITPLNEGVSPSQSFDGSGGAETGTPPAIPDNND